MSRLLSSFLKIVLFYVLEKLSSKRHASCEITTAPCDKANHIIQMRGSTLSDTGYRDRNNFSVGTYNDMVVGICINTRVAQFFVLHSSKLSCTTHTNLNSKPLYFINMQSVSSTYIFSPSKLISILIGNLCSR